MPAVHASKETDLSPGIRPAAPPVHVAFQIPERYASAMPIYNRREHQVQRRIYYGPSKKKINQ
jgi:hypothetical protein